MKKITMMLVFFLFLFCLTAAPTQKVCAAEMDPLKKQISDWVDTKREKIVRLSEAIWSYAELGMQEHRSAKAITDFLKSEGFKVQTGVAGMPTAFVATWGEGKPSIGFISEYDALPMLSNKPVPKKDPYVEGAPGHGCGHNLFGAGDAAAAAALKGVMEKNGIKGQVILFGTPAEETLVGKTYMHREGIFKAADIVLGWHPGTENQAGTDTNMAVLIAKFRFKGITAHGARPQTGRSALDAVELMNVGVNYMREHIPMESRIHYIISQGGVQPNVVPDFAESWYYFRHPRIEEAAKLYDWAIKIANGAGMMTETTMSYETLVYCYNKLTNVAGARVLYDNLKLYGVPEFTPEEVEFAKAIQREVKAKEKGIDTTIKPFQEKGGMAFSSNDMGSASWATPIINLSMASRIEGVPGHTWADTAISGMSIGFKFMLNASKILAATGIDLATKPEAMQKVRAEFTEKSKAFKERDFLGPNAKPPVDQYKSEAARWAQLLKDFEKKP